MALFFLPYVRNIPPSKRSVSASLIVEHDESDLYRKWDFLQLFKTSAISLKVGEWVEALTSVKKLNLIFEVRYLCPGRGRIQQSWKACL